MLRGHSVSGSGDLQVVRRSKTTNVFSDALKQLDLIEARKRDRTQKKTGCCYVGLYSQFRVWWGVLQIIFGLYLVLAAPFRFGFLDDGDWSMLVDWGVDVFMLLDFLMRLFLFVAMDEQKMTVVSGCGNIFSHTLSKNRLGFICSFIAVLPVDILFLPVSWTAVYAARMLKLLHLHALENTLQYLIRVRFSVSFDPLKTRLLRDFCIILYGAHLFACCFFRLGLYMFHNGTESVWFTIKDPGGIDHEILFFNSTSSTWSSVSSCPVDDHSACSYTVTAPAFAAYLKSFYFAIVTLSSVGYGDFYPQTETEMGLVMLAQIFGWAAYGSLVGKMTPLLETVASTRGSYFKKIDRLQAFMNTHGVKHSVQRKIIAFGQSEFARFYGAAENDIVQKNVPEIYRSEVGWFLAGDALLRLPFLDPSVTPNYGLRRLSSALRYHQFLPGDTVVRKGEFTDRLFIVLRGRAHVLQQRTRQRGGSNSSANGSAETPANPAVLGNVADLDQGVLRYVSSDILSQQVAVDLESGDFCCHDSFFFASMASDYSVLSASEVDTAYLTKDALQSILVACEPCYGPWVLSVRHGLDRERMKAKGKGLEPIYAMKEWRATVDAVRSANSNSNLNAPTSKAAATGSQLVEQKSLTGNNSIASSVTAVDMPTRMSTENRLASASQLTAEPSDGSLYVRASTRKEQVSENATFKEVWDLISLLGMLYYAMIIPFRVSLWLQDWTTFETSDYVYFVLDWVVDFFFVIDVFMRLFVFRYGFRQLTVAENRKMYRNHYLQGEFVLHALALVPLDVFEFAGLFGSGRSLKRLVYFRLNRLLRVHNLRSVYRKVGSAGQRRAQHVGKSIITAASFFSIFRLVALAAILYHWVALVFFFIADNQTSEQGATTWLTEEGLIQLVGGSVQVTSSKLRRYMRSIYWALVSGSLVGFGDITPVTFYEIGFTVLFVSFGTLVYLYILAEITVYAAHLNAADAEYNQHMEIVNSFLKYVNYFIGEHWQLSDTHASKERKTHERLMLLEDRVRDYVTFLWSVQRDASSSTISLLEEFPSHLRRYVIASLAEPILSAHPDLYIMKGEKVFLRMLADQMKTVVYAQLDWIVFKGAPHLNAYVLLQGCVQKTDDVPGFLQHVDLTLMSPKHSRFNSTGDDNRQYRASTASPSAGDRADDDASTEKDEKHLVHGPRLFAEDVLLQPKIVRSVLTHKISFFAAEPSTALKISGESFHSVLAANPQLSASVHDWAMKNAVEEEKVSYDDDATSEAVYIGDSDSDDEDFDRQYTATMVGAKPHRQSTSALQKTYIHAGIRPTDPCRVKWSWVQECIMLWYAVVVPLRIGFITNPDSSSQIYVSVATLAVDGLCDFLVWIDILILRSCFFSDIVQGRPLSPRKSFLRYLKAGSFWIDVISTFALDNLVLIFVEDNAFRVLFWLRLLRMLHLRRFDSVFERLLKSVSVRASSKGSNNTEKIDDDMNAESQKSSSVLSASAFINIFKQFAMVLVFSHFFACIFWFIGRSQDRVISWKNQPSAPVFGSPDDPEITAVEEMLRAYLNALYFSFVAFSTVGYGDIKPRTTSETMCTLAGLLLGLVLYAGVTGNIASVLANVDAVKDEHTAKEENSERAMSHYFSETNVYMDRVKSYFRRLWVSTKGVEPQETMDSLSTFLKEDLATEMYKRILLRTQVTARMPMVVIRKLANALQVQYYDQYDDIVGQEEISQRMWIVLKGLVVRRYDQEEVERLMFPVEPNANSEAINGRSPHERSNGKGPGVERVYSPETKAMRRRREQALGRPEVEEDQYPSFGEANVLSYIPLRQTTQYECLTNVNTLTLTHADFLSVLVALPDNLSKRLRRRFLREAKAQKDTLEQHLKLQSGPNLVKGTKLSSTSKRSTGRSIRRSQNSTFGKAEWTVKGFSRLFSRDDLFRQFWDLFIFLGIIYHLITVPALAIFLGAQNTQKYWTLIGVSWGIDLVFIADLFLRMRRFVPFYYTEKKAKYSGTSLMIFGPPGVAAHYFKMKHGCKAKAKRLGALLLDWVSVLPLDALAVAVALATGDDLAGAQDWLGLFRINHILLAYRYMQLLNQIDYYANQNSFFLFQVFSVRVGKLASAIVLTLHYLACVWYVVGDQVDGTTWVTVNDINARSPFGRYILSLYWSVTTITTVGYGDLTPQNGWEILISIVAILVGTILYADIIGSFAMRESKLYRPIASFKHQIKVLSKWMKYRKLPPRLRRNIIAWNGHMYHEGSEVDEDIVLDNLPPDIFYDISEKINDQFFSALPFFNTIADFDTRLLASLLHRRVYLAGDVIFAQGDVSDRLVMVLYGPVYEYSTVPQDELDAALVDTRYVQTPEERRLQSEAKALRESKEDMADDSKEPDTQKPAQEEDILDDSSSSDEDEKKGGAREQRTRSGVSSFSSATHLPRPSGSVWVLGQTLDIKDVYDFGQQIGQPGQYGRAVVATKRNRGPNDPEEVAIKIVSKARFLLAPRSTSVQDALQAFRDEVSIMSKMEHPNIIKFYEAYEDAENFYIVMEKCTGGELFDRITAMGQYKESDAARVLRQLFKAIDYMHRKKKVCHNDLKPDNALFLSEDPDAPLKIIDFGMAKLLAPREKLTKFAGTLFYVAPEVLDQEYNFSADVWSLGVVMFTMLFGYPPFHVNRAKHGDATDHMVYKMIRDEGFIPEIRPGYGNYFPQSIPISAEARDLISRILVKDVAARPTADEVLDHPWMRGKVDRPVSKKVIKDLMSFQKTTKFKARVLELMMDTLGEDDLVALERSFAAIDANGDGNISYTELHRALRKQGFSNERINNIWESADIDGDGSISYKELMLTSVHRKMKAKEERLFAAFSRMDLDQDGSITVQELAQVLSATDDVEAERLLAEIDKDGNGVIDYDEFLSVWMEQEEQQVLSRLPSLDVGALTLGAPEFARKTSPSLSSRAAAHAAYQSYLATRRGTTFRTEEEKKKEQSRRKSAKSDAAGGGLCCCPALDSPQFVDETGHVHVAMSSDRKHAPPRLGTRYDSGSYSTNYVSVIQRLGAEYKTIEQGELAGVVDFLSGTPHTTTVEAAHRSWKDVLAGHKFGSVSSVETLILHREDLAVLFRLYEHCKSEWLEAMFDYLKTEREDFHGDAQKRVEKFWSNLAARQPRVSSLVKARAAYGSRFCQQFVDIVDTMNPTQNLLPASYHRSGDEEVKHLQPEPQQSGDDDSDVPQAPPRIPTFDAASSVDSDAPPDLPLTKSVELEMVKVSKQSPQNGNGRHAHNSSSSSSNSSNNSSDSDDMDVEDVDSDAAPSEMSVDVSVIRSQAPQSVISLSRKLSRQVEDSDEDNSSATSPGQVSSARGPLRQDSKLALKWGRKVKGPGMGPRGIHRSNSDMFFRTPAIDELSDSDDNKAAVSSSGSKRRPKKGSVNSLDEELLSGSSSARALARLRASRATPAGAGSKKKKRTRRTNSTRSLPGVTRTRRKKKGSRR